MPAIRLAQIGRLFDILAVYLLMAGSLATALANRTIIIGGSEPFFIAEITSYVAFQGFISGCRNFFGLKFCFISIVPLS